MSKLEEIYARWYYMVNYTSRIYDNIFEVDGAFELFEFAYKQCVRMERMYGDMFFAVRESVNNRFLRLEDGRWAFRFVITGVDKVEGV